jgi:hypothetical protein
MNMEQMLSRSVVGHTNHPNSGVIMKGLAITLALAAISGISTLTPASAQVVRVERSVVYGANPMQIAPRTLLRSDFVVAPGQSTVLGERVLSFPAVIEMPPSSIYKPGIHLPGRYSK